MTADELAAKRRTPYEVRYSRVRGRSCRLAARWMAQHQPAQWAKIVEYAERQTP